MSEPYYQDDSVRLYLGDCLDVLRALPDASVDSVVTDPPYGLEFMGKDWDKFGTNTNQGYREKPRITKRPDAVSAYSSTGNQGVNSFQAGAPFQKWCTLWTAECLRVLKPGGHLLAFGGTRTWHRLACAVEDAGFEVRDSIAWLYGSGFPKSLDVSKAIDKAAGAERKVVGVRDRLDQSSKPSHTFGYSGPMREQSMALDITAPATPDAERWQGWGTALKPAFEPVVVARKPLSGTVAATVLEHGTGALNIDGCRIPHGGDIASAKGAGLGAGRATANVNGPAFGSGLGGIVAEPHMSGRWPANVVLDEEMARRLDEQSGERTSGALKPYTERHENASSFRMERDKTYEKAADTGGASRFFPTFRYEAKAPTSERPRVNGTAHPTVKPLDLCRWLVRLVTPPGGTVLEPFAGSGTTVEACIVEGFHCIAIEREADYLPLIMQRVNRRRDPVAYIEAAGDDLGLFGIGELA